MSEDTINAIVKAIAPLAEKIGQTGDAAFQLYVREAIFNGYGQIAFGIVAVIFSIVMFSVAWLIRNHKESNYGGDSHNSGLWGFPVALGAVFLLVGFLLMFFGARDLYNPQFRAMEYVICDFAHEEGC